MLIKAGVCAVLLVMSILWFASDQIFKPGNHLTHIALAKQDPALSITIVYDNYSFNPELQTAWGFSCLVEGKEKTILFDTGGDGEILLSNMEKLGIDPEKVDTVVLSHIHGDHIGGLHSFLAAHPKIEIYLPHCFPESFKNSVRVLGAEIVEVKDTFKICEGIFSTGEMGAWIKEQSLVVKTPKGLVIITGCAHPGIVSIIQKTKEIMEDEIYLVLGGFHLAGAEENQLNKIVQEFKEKRVEKVAPCHCSGDLTRKLFQKAYGENFIAAGVGKKIVVED